MRAGCRLAVFLCILEVSALCQSAAAHLTRAADAYKRLRSLQVEAFCERRMSNGRLAATAVVRLFSAPPNRARIEMLDQKNVLQSVLIANGEKVTEYRGWSKEFTRVPAAGISVQFNPRRGVGWGEMSYETVAEGVSKASIKGRQTLLVGRDRIDCVVIDVEYKGELSKYAFWIAENSGLILRRIATYASGEGTASTISSVRALTTNEDLSDTVFEFTPPPGAREVESSTERETPVATGVSTPDLSTLLPHERAWALTLPK